jgi:hypothetical protein
MIKENMVLINSDKIKMKKIKFNVHVDFNSSYERNFANIEISQCEINGYIYWNENTYSDVVISNIILGRFNGSISTSSSVMVTNCIIYEDNFSGFFYLTLQNNIIVAYNSGALPNSVNNNIFTGANNFPSVNTQSGNWENVVLSDLFVNQPENKWDASYDYHLKNPANYVGTDGTQVGIYGGLFPWNPTPSNPQIIESKVNPTTTNDGKLNFQIKVEAQQ